MVQRDEFGNGLGGVRLPFEDRPHQRMRWVLRSTLGRALAGALPEAAVLKVAHQLRRVLERVFEDREVRRRLPETARAGQAPVEATESGRMVGRDPAMVEIFKLIGQVAGTRTTVVIRGESGTGKELVAREIHACSPYAAEPFVAVNCTALPATLLESELFGHVKGAFTDRKGRFALAGRGTILLV